MTEHNVLCFMYYNAYCWTEYVLCMKCNAFLVMNITLNLFKWVASFCLWPPIRNTASTLLCLVGWAATCICWYCIHFWLLSKALYPILVMAIILTMLTFYWDRCETIFWPPYILTPRSIYRTISWPRGQYIVTIFWPPSRYFDPPS